MIPVLGQIARPLVMWIIQLAVTSAGFVLVEKALDKLQQAIRDHYDIDEQDSRAVVANVILDGLALLGIGAALIHTKIPVRLTRKLGLNGRSPKRPKVSNEGARKIIAKDAKQKKWTRGQIFSLLGTVVGLPWVVLSPVMLVQQFGDQGTFQPRQANRIYEKWFGIKPFPESDPLESPGPFKTNEFTDYARALERQGVSAINDPCKQQTVLYSRKALAELVECIYGREVSKGNDPSKKKIVSMLAQYLRGKTSTSAVTTPQTLPSHITAPQKPPAVKVFTGFVSSGRLAPEMEFEPREDDLISDTDELQAAAQNNLASFVASLPSRFVYEIKLVPSVITKDGLRRYGERRRVISGYYKNDTPRYKNVINKFAVLDVYILKGGGRRSKFDRIVLGPVDAVSFQPDRRKLASMAFDLTANTVQREMPTKLATAKPMPLALEMAIDEIKPQNEATESPTTREIIPRDYYVERDGFFDRVFYRYGDTIYSTTFVDDFFTNDEKVSMGNYGDQIKAVKKKLLELGIDVDSFRRDPYPYEIQGRRPRRGVVLPWKQFFYEPTPGTKREPVAVLQARANEARNLTEYYSAYGTQLPPVSARAKRYAAFGLGPENYYTGTAEQNTRLLAHMQRHGYDPRPREK